MRPPPGLIPAQFCLTSAAHSLAIAAALSTTARQFFETSAKWALMQALIRPSPGWIPAHCALRSATQAFTIGPCCLNAVEHESSNAVNIINDERQLAALGFLRIVMNALLRCAWFCAGGNECLRW